MLQTFNTIINETIEPGNPLQRWLLSIVIMIEEIPSTSIINKLRIINIYESYYNLLQKFFWPKLSTKYAEATKTLGENAWGCRPGCSAENVALIDEFVTEVYRLTFNNLFKLQHDAIACFDRIINSHTILNSRKFVVLDKIYHIHSSTFRNTEYRVQTILGTSTEYCKHTTSDPIDGNNQGEGSSGTNWVYVSVPITSNLDRNEEGCTIISPDNNIKWEKVILEFVDDKRQYANDWKNNSLLNALKTLQSAAQSWEHLRYTSGGKV